jgi:drug/metabolite transporter (DMT)-like permease
VLVGVVLALGAAVAFGVAALLQFVAAREQGAAGAVDPRLLLAMLRRPSFLAALALNLLGFGLHFTALRLLPLFLAQTIIGSSVAVTALLSARLLGALLARAEYAAVAAVCLGLALLGVASGHSGTATTSAGQRAWLLALTAALLAAGAAAGRARGTGGALLLGLLAGLGFAVVAISARLLPTFVPPAVLADPGFYALLCAGAVAFLLYTAALQRGAAVTGTAAMVLTQTAGPALVGVVALGDSVRPGWAPVAAVGLLLAAGGAVLLARFDPQAASAEQPGAGGAAAPGAAPTQAESTRAARRRVGRTG